MKKILSFTRIDFDLCLKFFLPVTLITAAAEWFLLQNCLLKLTYGVSDGQIFYDLPSTDQVADAIRRSLAEPLFLIGISACLLISILLWDESNGRSHMRYTTYRTNVPLPLQTLGFALGTLWRLLLFWSTQTLVIYGALARQYRIILSGRPAGSLWRQLMEASFSSSFLHTLLPLRDPIQLLVDALFLLTFASMAGNAATSQNSLSVNSALLCGGFVGITNTVFHMDLHDLSGMAFALGLLLFIFGTIWFLNLRYQSRQTLYSNVKGSIYQESEEYNG